MILLPLPFCYMLIGIFFAGVIYIVLGERKDRKENYYSNYCSKKREENDVSKKH